MSSTLLGIAVGSLGYAAIAGDRFAIPLRPYFAALAVILVTVGVLHMYGL